VNPSDQVRVKSRDRMTVLKMPVTKMALQAEPSSVEIPTQEEKK
jgi:hypothetical protein